MAVKKADRTCVICGRVFPSIRKLLAHQIFDHRESGKVPPENTRGAE